MSSHQPTTQSCRESQCSRPRPYPNLTPQPQPHLSPLSLTPRYLSPLATSRPSLLALHPLFCMTFILTNHSIPHPTPKMPDCNVGGGLASLAVLVQAMPTLLDILVICQPSANVVAALAAPPVCIPNPLNQMPPPITPPFQVGRPPPFAPTLYLVRMDVILSSDVSSFDPVVFGDLLHSQLQGSVARDDIQASPSRIPTLTLTLGLALTIPSTLIQALTLSLISQLTYAAASTRVTITLPALTTCAADAFANMLLNFCNQTLAQDAAQWGQWYVGCTPVVVEVTTDAARGCAGYHCCVTGPRAGIACWDSCPETHADGGGVCEGFCGEGVRCCAQEQAAFGLSPGCAQHPPAIPSSLQLLTRVPPPASPSDVGTGTDPGPPMDQPGSLNDTEALDSESREGDGWISVMIGPVITTVLLLVVGMTVWRYRRCLYKWRAKTKTAQVDAAPMDSMSSTNEANLQPAGGGNESGGEGVADAEGIEGEAGAESAAETEVVEGETGSCGEVGIASYPLAAHSANEDTATEAGIRQPRQALAAERDALTTRQAEVSNLVERQAGATAGFGGGGNESSADGVLSAGSSAGLGAAATITSCGSPSSTTSKGDRMQSVEASDRERVSVGRESAALSEQHSNVLNEADDGREYTAALEYAAASRQPMVGQAPEGAGNAACCAQMNVSPILVPTEGELADEVAAFDGARRGGSGAGNAHGQARVGARQARESSLPNLKQPSYYLQLGPSEARIETSSRKALSRPAETDAPQAGEALSEGAVTPDGELTNDERRKIQQSECNPQPLTACEMPPGLPHTHELSRQLFTCRMDLEATQLANKRLTAQAEAARAEAAAIKKREADLSALRKRNQEDPALQGASRLAAAERHAMQERLEERRLERERVQADIRQRRQALAAERDALTTRQAEVHKEVSSLVERQAGATPGFEGGGNVSSADGVLSTGSSAGLGAAATITSCGSPSSTTSKGDRMQSVEVSDRERVSVGRESAALSEQHSNVLNEADDGRAFEYAAASRQPMVGQAPEGAGNAACCAQMNVSPIPVPTEGELADEVAAFDGARRGGSGAGNAHGQARVGARQARESNRPMPNLQQPSRYLQLRPSTAPSNVMPRDNLPVASP